MRRLVSGTIILLLITSTLLLCFEIQPVRSSGTIYIRADGSIDPPTVPIQRDGYIYAFTDNIYDSIVVERNNIILDGQNYSLQGNWMDESKGLDLTERKNVTVKNLEIKQFCYGISLERSINNSISGNNITANNQIPIHNIQEAGHGIRLDSTSNNNSIFGNNIRNNWYGIGLDSTSNNNSIFGNYIANNDEGIRLWESSNNNIFGNVLVNDGLTVYHSYENVVDDNWVNGKPLVYLEDVSDRIVEDAGQVILVNCSHIKVRNLSLSNTTIGVQLSQTENTEIFGNNITANSDLGIRLDSTSNNNSIFGNYIANNDEGIQLYESSNNNNIFGNNITANNWDGIQLYESSNNNIFDNNITVNSQSGTRLYRSSNNSIFGNNITANAHEGVFLIYSSNNNSIFGNDMAANGWDCIWLRESSNNNIFDNNITASREEGIQLYLSSNNNSIFGNYIANNDEGIRLIESSNNNSIFGNYIANNFRSISLTSSVDNVIYHNNFIDNTLRAHAPGYGNFWDEGYPSSGNYWSDYDGTDIHSGLYQNETGSDGIGDTPYIINENDKDNYPFMSPISFFDAGTWNNTSYNVDASSNSTILDFHFNASEGAFLRLVVKGDNGTKGYCRVIIPKDLLWTESGWNVTVNGTPVNYTETSYRYYTYLYFAYNHSTKTITIHGTNVIPEFPSLIISLLFMTVTLLAAIVYRKRRLKS